MSKKLMGELHVSRARKKVYCDQMHRQILGE
jgi:hypothetical protein